MTETRIPQPHIAQLTGLVWLVVATQLLWMYWAETAKVLGDADDAMRLLQVRNLLGGQSWFDLHEPRLQPPSGYDTHWSRLIDGGLAGLYLIFRLIAEPALAERLMRVVWPLLWLLPAMAGTLALAWRLAGRPAAIVALLLLLMGLPAFMQFKPGRIDHHDVQITLAILTLAAAIWADRIRWAGWAAGVLSSLALAIGVEGVAFIVLGGALLAARFASDRRHGEALARYGYSAAASIALVFVTSIAPHLWMASACDAMAINSALPALLGTIALGIAGHRLALERLGVRCGAITIAAGLAIATFVLLEPQCLKGPLAMVDPTVRPIWLAHVSEAQSLLDSARRNWGSGFGIAIYPFVALVCGFVVARDERVRYDSGFLGLAAALLIAIAMTMVAVRAATYALWFSMPFVAAAMLPLFTRLRLESLPAKALVTIPFTPVVLAGAIVATIEAAGAPQETGGTGNPECFEIKNYASLARLPAGLIITDVDYGPFVLALTPHSVLAAPYHRLSFGIVASHQVFNSPPDRAREILRQAQANYVMICGTRGAPDKSANDSQRSLWTQVKGGNIPSWLEPIAGTEPFNVYRVRPQKSGK
jgi:hypothetical protein